MSSPSVPSMEEASDFFLDCARYGDVEDLLSCIAFGVDINFKDASGNTALHKGVENLQVLRLFTNYCCTFNSCRQRRNLLHANSERQQHLVLPEQQWKYSSS